MREPYCFLDPEMAGVVMTCVEKDKKGKCVRFKPTPGAECIVESPRHPKIPAKARRKKRPAKPTPKKKPAKPAARRPSRKAPLPISEWAGKYLQAAEQKYLSQPEMAGYKRGDLVKLARRIANIHDSDEVKSEHMAEAIQYGGHVNILVGNTVWHMLMTAKRMTITKKQLDDAFQERSLPIYGRMEEVFGVDVKPLIVKQVAYVNRLSKTTRMSKSQLVEDLWERQAKPGFLKPRAKPTPIIPPGERQPRPIKKPAMKIVNPDVDIGKRAGFTEHLILRRVNSGSGYQRILGKPVTIKGFEEFDFFIHHPLAHWADYKELPKSWAVSEVSTGQRIPTGGQAIKVQKEVVSKAQQSLEIAGKKLLVAAMKALPKIKQAAVGFTGLAPTTMTGVEWTEAKGKTAQELEPPPYGAINYSEIDETKPQPLVYRGITSDEAAFIADNRIIKSSQAFSVPGEGTSFAQDFYAAESAVNFGRTDPKKTGKPNYVIEVKSGRDIKVDPRDYFPKAQKPVPASRIERAWRFNPDGSMEPVFLKGSKWVAQGGNPGGFTGLGGPILTCDEWQLVAYKVSGRTAAEIRKLHKGIVEAARRNLANAIGDKKIFAVGSEVALARKSAQLEEIDGRWAYKKKITPEIRKYVRGLEKVQKRAGAEIARATVRESQQAELMIRCKTFKATCPSPDVKVIPGPPRTPTRPPAKIPSELKPLAVAVRKYAKYSDLVDRAAGETYRLHEPESPASVAVILAQRGYGGGDARNTQKVIKDFWRAARAEVKKPSAVIAPKKSIPKKLEDLAKKAEGFDSFDAFYDAIPRLIPRVELKRGLATLLGPEYGIGGEPTIEGARLFWNMVRGPGPFVMGDLSGMQGLTTHLLRSVVAFAAQSII